MAAWAKPVAGKVVPGACPWCKRDLFFPAEMELPQVFKCSTCLKVFIMVGESKLEDTQCKKLVGSGR